LKFYVNETYDTETLKSRDGDETETLECRDRDIGVTVSRRDETVTFEKNALRPSRDRDVRRPRLMKTNGNMTNDVT